MSSSRVQISFTGFSSGPGALGVVDAPPRAAGVAAPEAAAGIEGVDRHLLGLEPGGLGGVALIDGLELVAGPDLARLAGELDEAGQRLHRRMREGGELERRGE